MALQGVILDVDGTLVLSNDGMVQNQAILGNKAGES